MTLLLRPSGTAVHDHDEDFEYYRRRAAEELDKARKADTPGLAAKHRQLATIYSSRALQAERKREIDESGDSADEVPLAD